MLLLPLEGPNSPRLREMPVARTCWQQAYCKGQGDGNVCSTAVPSGDTKFPQSGGARSHLLGRSRGSHASPYLSPSLTERDRTCWRGRTRSHLGRGRVEPAAGGILVHLLFRSGS